MKKNIHIIGFLLALVFTSCIQDDIIELDANSTTIKIIKEKDRVLDPGGNLQVNATYTEANRVFEKAVFKWVSEDPSIATIDPQGLVTAISQGTTSIYAEAYGFSSAKSSIQVVEDTSAAHSAIISTPRNSLLITETALLSIEAQNINGHSTTAGNVSWESLTPEIATINQTTGQITPVAPGNAIFQATADGVVSNRLTVSIGNDANAVATVEIFGNSTTLMSNESLTLRAEIKNFNGDLLTGQVIWSSSNDAVATINSMGMVNSLSEGTVVLTATYQGISDTYEIDVMDLSSQFRRGTLRRLTYDTDGTVELELTSDNQLRLNFINFDQPDALRLPGVVVYLANSDNASNAKATGLRIGRVPQVSGNFTMMIPSGDPVGDFTKFSRVLIMCEPFTISMATAPFEN